MNEQSIRRVWRLVLLMCVGCTPATAKQAPPTGEAPAIMVGSPVKKVLPRSSDQPGHIEAFAQTALVPKISGYVKAIHKDIGDIVKAGELLAELDVPEMVLDLTQKQALVQQADAEAIQSRALLAAAEAGKGSAAPLVEEAKAGRKRVRAMFDRWKGEADRVAGLAERKVIDAQTSDETLHQYRAAAAALEEVEAKVRSAEAALIESGAKRDKAAADVAVADAKAKVARADEGRVAAMLAYARITAPFAGVVTIRGVDVGHLLQPGGKDQIFVVATTDKVRVFIDVPEVDAAFVGKDAAAAVRVSGLGGRTIGGTVSRTSWALDVRSRTLKCAIDLDNAAGQLRPGMYVNVSIKLTPPESWTLPATAVQRVGDTSYVYLVRDGKAQRVPIRLGGGDGKVVEVIERYAAGADGKPAWGSFVEGERVVLTGGGSLNEGAAVADNGR